MDLTLVVLPIPLNIAALLLCLLAGSWVVSRVDWTGLVREKYLHKWLLSVFYISLLWLVRTGLESGINVHFLGTTLLTLMFGWRLGTLGMICVCLSSVFWGNSHWLNMPLMIAVHAFLGVSLAYTIFLVVEAKLPRNPYIYFFITAFFGSAIVYAAVGTVYVVILGSLNVYSWDLLLDHYLPFYLLMSFGEAFLSCGLITLMVVYYPEWVYTFRDKRYLVN